MFAFVALFFTVSADEAETAETIRPLFCIDGDTLVAAPDSQRYRLWGVDAPEPDQRRGTTAPFRSDA